MRMRNKPWAKGELEACPYYLSAPSPPNPRGPCPESPGGLPGAFGRY